MTVSDEIYDLIEEAHAQIDALPSARLDVRGRGLTAGDLAKRLITKMATSPAHSHWDVKGTKPAQRVAGAMAVLADKDLQVLAWLFSIQDVNKVVARKRKVMNVVVDTGVTLVPTHCWISRPIGSNHYETQDFVLMGPIAPMSNATLLQAMRKYLKGDETVFINSDWALDTKLEIISPTFTATYNFRRNFQELTLIEADTVAEDIFNDLKKKRRLHVFGELKTKSPQLQKLQNQVDHAMGSLPAERGVEVDVVKSCYNMIWVHIQAVNDKDKVGVYEFTWSEGKKIRARMTSLIDTMLADGDYAVHPLLGAYLAKAYGKKAQKIIAEAHTRINETWNVPEKNGAQSPVWIKIHKGEICGRFPLGEGVFWTYDRLTLSKAFFAKMPASIAAEIEASLQPGDLLERYIDMTAIPGMEQVRVEKVNRSKGAVMLTLDVKAGDIKTSDLAADHTTDLLGAAA